MTKVGFVTIGQSPRYDIEDIWDNLIEVEVEQIGILDGYTSDEIYRNFVSKENQNILVTKTRDGSTIKIDKKQAYTLIQKSVNKLEELNCEIIVVLCTDKFPEIKTNSILIELNDLLIHSTKIIYHNKKIGIVIPDINQQEQLVLRWNNIGIDPVVFVANPYGPIHTFQRVALDISKENLDIIVLDCLGYDKRVKAELSKVINSKILVPRILLNGYIKSIL